MTASPTTPSSVPASVPADGLKGLAQNWKSDLASGLLVSLIALPLCLGIAMASGFPAFGGLITAIVGGLVVGPLCGSRLSIKGPAAGLIAIAIASVEALGHGDNSLGYKCTLAVLVVSAACQMLFAIFKLGRFGDFFPASVVHGMLAAIGVIIFSKQIHPLLGVKPVAKEPIPLLMEIPHSLANLNPQVALVGLVSVLIVLLAPKLLGKVAKFLPAPLLAVLAGVGFSLFFGFTTPHSYTWSATDYAIEPRHLVTLPSNFIDGFTFPDFSQLFSMTSVQFIIMFSLIGSIESLLTVKAVDTIDPFKRKSDLNRDLLALGFGNFLTAFLGGLPMISEVVRSFANTTYGAKTRWSNFFHGAFLLVYLAVLADAIHNVPVAALAGILCVTGYRLAAPKHFIECKHIGTEQLVVFTSTIVGTLLTDLLIGVFIGVAVKLICCIVMGAPARSFFSKIRTDSSDSATRLNLKMPKACTFTNVIGFKALMNEATASAIILDFSDSVFVDHTFMREVILVKSEAAVAGTSFSTPGLEKLTPASHHPEAARRFAIGTSSTHSL